MTSAVRYFFDLPVYRLPRERYYEEREAFIEKHISPEADSPRDLAFRDHLQRAYGGPWEFNEIIGFIKLHFLGSQIRGEYFAVRRKRIVRTRKKIFEFHTLKLAPEVSVNSATSATILVSVNTYIEACRKEVPRRHIDTELFDAIAPYMDWKGLYDT